MQRRVVGCILVMLVPALCAGAGPVGQTGPAEAVILDTSGFWRCFTVLDVPVVRKAGELKTLKPRVAWLNRRTSLPTKGWMKPEFDDGAWHRCPPMAFCVPPVYGLPQRFSPFMKIMAMRSRFRVTNPARVKGLKVSVTYHGGAILYLNGHEIARGHFPKGCKVGPETLAEDYGDAEPYARKLQDVPVPRNLLRKGVNVLALEIHRAPYRDKDIKMREMKFTEVTITWGSCGLKTIRLKAATGDGIVPNVSRPKGFQVWNSGPLTMDFDLDFGDPNEPLRPIYIVGTPNGSFSGKVVVGSSGAVEGLRAVAGALTRAGGGKRIPASAVRVRYALPTGPGAYVRYLATPTCFGALADEAPTKVPVRSKNRTRRGRWARLNSPGVSPVFGAVTPIWVTIDVPADAQAGDYEGELTIHAKGVKPARVPIKVRVCGWKLPETTEYRTFVDVVQSPESVAMHYEAPLWGKKHFKLLEKSLKLLGQAGNKVAYIPLVCQTNMGNAETMVRWIKQPDGSYRHDFSVMEKYLDLVEKHQGKPTVVCLYVFDYNCDERKKPRGFRGVIPTSTGEVPVSGVNGDGKVSTIKLPRYADPRSKALWKPVIDGVRERLRKRGLEKEMMFGISSDILPAESIVSLFKELSPRTLWVNAAHPPRTNVHGVPCGYTAGVWQRMVFAGGGTGRLYGWKKRELIVHFPRSIIGQRSPVTTFRHVGELNIAGNQRGFARLGGDFWMVLKDRRGRRRSSIASRYPETGWRNLDIRTMLLYPGRDGAISTMRFDMLCEGLQECEARIFIEKALIDRKLRAKLGDELARRCQTVLDERIPPLRTGVSTLLLSGTWTGFADIDNTWWQASGQIGYHWYVGSGWQKRSEKLFTAAAEVAKTIHGK